MDIWYEILIIIVLVFVVSRIDKRLNDLQSGLDEIKYDLTQLLEKIPPEYDQTIGEWIDRKGHIVDRFTGKPRDT